MTKLTLPNIASGYLDTDSLNSAFRLIEEMAEKVVYRTGDVPNQMEADLDLNGFSLLNSTAGVGNALVTYEQLQAAIAEASSGLLAQNVQSFTATAGQTLFTLTEMVYQPGANNLAVYKNGVRLFAGAGFVETNGASFTLTSPASLNDVVVAVANDFLSTIVVAPHTHPWSQIVGPPVYTTRWPTWLEVSDKPVAFPPIAHVHSTADITSGAGLADARRGVWVQATQPTATRTGDLWFY